MNLLWYPAKVLYIVNALTGACQRHPTKIHQSIYQFVQEPRTEAEELEVEVMKTQKRVLGREHPDMLTSMASLALTYGNQGRWKEAEELEVEVMEMRKRPKSCRCK